VAVSSFLQNRYDISVLDNEKAYVNNPHWPQELYIVSRNVIQEVAQPAQKLEVAPQDSYTKQGKWNGRQLRTWYMHVRSMYEKVVLNLVQRN